MMKQLRHISVIAIALLASAAMAMPASAKPAKGKSKTERFVPPMSQTFIPAERNQLPKWAQQRISYSQAKSIALRRYPGAKYIDTRLNGNTYTVKLLLKNNRMVNVKIDAVTGRVR